MSEDPSQPQIGSALRYAKAAFWAGIDVPALGRLPVNVLGVLGAAILGFGEHAVWLLGLGLETTYLFAMTFNPRFQRSVNARELQGSREDVQAKRRGLIGQLPAEAQRRLGELDRSCERVLQINQQNDDIAIGANREALQRLQWVYLKLLVARDNLLSAGKQESDGNLPAKVASLEAELAKGVAPESLRESKAATLEILRERLNNVRRRHESLEEIESDLTRIEAQVHLLIENASIQGKSHTISMDLELASNLANSLFSEPVSDISSVDQTSRSRGRERS